MPYDQARRTALGAQSLAPEQCHQLRLLRQHAGLELARHALRGRFASAMQWPAGVEIERATARDERLVDDWRREKTLSPIQQHGFAGQQCVPVAEANARGKDLVEQRTARGRQREPALLPIAWCTAR